MDTRSKPLDILIEKGLVIRTEKPKNKAPACYERGLQAKENLRKRIEVDRQRKECEELRELTASPSLCPKSLQLASHQHRSDFNTYAVRWKEERDQKLALARLQETIQTDQSSRPKSPVPAPPGYKSPVRDWKCHYEQYQSVRSGQGESGNFTPEIDVVSRKMMAKREPLEVRLQREEQERRQKLTAEREKAKASVAESLSFTPVVNQSCIDRPGNVAEHLYAVGMEASRKKREVAEKGLPYGCTFRPELNRSTAELAAKYRTKTPPVRSQALLPGGKEQMSQERLNEFLQRNYTQTSLKAKSKTAYEDPECTFQPSTSSTTTSRSGTKDMYTRSIARLKASQAKLASCRMKQTEEELAACTFQPQVLRRSATPPPSKPCTDSCAAMELKPNDSFSRDSTVCTINLPDRREVLYKDEEQTYDLQVRWWEGQPSVVEEVEAVEVTLKSLGIEW